MLLVAMLCFFTVLLIVQSCLLWMVARGVITFGPTKLKSESAKTQTVWEKTEAEHQNVKLVSTPRSRHSSSGHVFVAPAAGERYHLNPSCVQLKGAKAVKPYLLCRTCERLHG